MYINLLFNTNRRTFLDSSNKYILVALYKHQMIDSYFTLTLLSLITALLLHIIIVFTLFDISWIYRILFWIIRIFQMIALKIMHLKLFFRYFFEFRCTNILAIFFEGSLFKIIIM